MQNAIDQAAGARVPLVLGPGVYRAGDLRLPTGAQIVGVRGATRLLFTQGPSLLSAHRRRSRRPHRTRAGRRRPSTARWAWPCAHEQRPRHPHDRLRDRAGAGIVLEGVEGEVTGSTVSDAANAAIFARNSRGLVIARNTIRAAGNNGIQVWRSEAGDDGTLVIDNRIEGILARSGGSGQNGNGINVFRAANVLVQGNRIRSCAFSAVRGNAASNLQVIANNCTGLGRGRALRRVRLRGRADRQQRGRWRRDRRRGHELQARRPARGRAGQRHPQSLPKRPAGTDPGDGAGIGIGVEADSTVSGNVIENAPYAGISIGFGQYLRDVAVDRQRGAHRCGRHRGLG